MKREDIDKKIGMPDVDVEWAKFEREVINPKTASRKPLYWGIGIAASIALVAGVFLFGHDTEEPQNLLTEQTAQQHPSPVGNCEVDTTGEQSDDGAKSVAKAAPSAVPPASQNNIMRLSGVYDSVVSDESLNYTDYDITEADKALQRRIAGLTIEPTSADLGPNAMRLGGIRVAGRDSVQIDRKTDNDLLAEVTPPIEEGVADDELQSRIAGLNIDGIELPDSVRRARRDSILNQREINMDSMLIVVNGTPIPSYKFGPNGVAIYLYKLHQLLADSDVDIEERISRAVYRPYGDSEEERKRRCFEIYGERAKYGVLEVTAVPDTYCDGYINKYPELKKERHHIEGYVYDEDNKPLADSWVYIRGKGIGAATDSTGYFSIWLPKTDVELKASHIGYVPYVIKTIKPMLTIRLRSATTIREVIVPPKQP